MSGPNTRDAFIEHVRCGRVIIDGIVSLDDHPLDAWDRSLTDREVLAEEQFAAIVRRGIGRLSAEQRLAGLRLLARIDELRAERDAFTRALRLLDAARGVAT